MRMLADEKSRRRWSMSNVNLLAQVLEQAEWQVRMPREQEAQARRKLELVGG
jgi:hypothetical protein